MKEAAILGVGISPQCLSALLPVGDLQRCFRTILEMTVALNVIAIVGLIVRMENARKDRKNMRITISIDSNKVIFNLF